MKRSQTAKVGERVMEKAERRRDKTESVGKYRRVSGKEDSQ